jgi:hypothetical protein
MKSILLILILVSNVGLNGALAEEKSGRVQVFRNDNNEDLKVLIEGEAAKALFENLSVIPKFVGPGTIVAKLGANIICYGGSANLGTENNMFSCVLSMNSDGAISIN